MSETTSVQTRMLRFLRRLCGAGLLVMVAACGSADPATELAEAEAQFQAGDLRTATIHVSNVLQAEPDNLPGLVLRGRISLAAGDPAGARDSLERARTLWGDDDSTTIPLVEALLQLGESDAALALLNESPESSRDAEFWILQGEALIGTGQLQEAAAALARSTQLGGESGRGLMAQAQIEMLREQPEAALELLDQAVDAAPEDPDVWSTRGAFHLRAQRLEEAARDLQAAADLYARGIISGKEAGVLSSLVQVYLTLNDLDGATAAARRLAARAPNSPVSNYSAGLIAYQNGQFDEAATSLQQAANSAPDNAQVLTLLGASHLALGNLGQAEQHLMNALGAAPNDPAAVKLLAETRLRQQRPDSALDLLARLGEDSADPQLDALQVAANLQAGNSEQALVYLEQAVARSPGNQALRLQLAQAYLGSGQNEEAVELLEGISGGDEVLSANLMLLFTHLRAQEIDAGRAQADELLASFPEEARAHSAVGVFYQLIGEGDRARTQLEEALERDDQFIPARLILAGLLAEEGRGPEAESQLQEVLAIEPDHAAALASLAQHALQRGSIDEAETLLTRAVASADTVPLHLALARVRLQQGNIPGAEQEVDAARALAPENPEVTGARGLLALRAGRTNEAIRLLEDAQQALPARLDIALALGQAQAATEDLAGARETFQRALETAPDYLPLRAALGATELRLGNADTALEISNSLTADYPEQAAGYLLEADVAMAQRRYDEAAARFEAAFERAPVWEVQSRRVLALQLAERTEDVEPLLTAWAADNPGHLAGRLMLANLFQTSGRAPEALSEYEDVLELQPENVVALNNAAWLYYESADSRALPLAQRAYELAPESAAVLDTFGWILAEQNREEEAIGYLQTAANLAPQALEIRYHVAQTQARLGRTNEARATLQALLAEEAQFGQREAAETLLESL